MNANNSRVKKKKQTRTESRVEPKAVPGSVQPKLTESFPIVGVGASAGGLEAFSELLRCLPENIGMAFVLVQHLDPSHLSMLQEILSRTSRMPVKEVTDGMVVEPDHVYVMPANSQAEMKGHVLLPGARAVEGGRVHPPPHPLRRNRRVRCQQGGWRHHVCPGCQDRQIRQHAAKRHQRRLH